nr:NAD(P)/FAD-dependent oxidoreductase [Kibdelosporangium sp. MJ126-NF4]CEL15580.1 Cyclohexanone monooxygenase [Kibdelosporangium sp. MJ126-NF4]CTQ98244.1 Cyclohexanone monooxygenase (EC 1.14.13.22) [Kibdelosporangium sp. MJ126-NF4]
MAEKRRASVLVIGAGMSGICMAAKLRQAGITDVTVLEKASDVGGTWRDNRYPGLECDVPSAFYQYSFDRNPHWSRLFSHGPEIHRYLSGAVDRLGIRSLIRLNTAVVRAEFGNRQWHVDTDSGERLTADFLVSATGVLHHPVLPDIPGLDAFAGPWFHSARWDHSADLAGKRVAVVGTGSTGAQITTALAGKVAHLDLYQRTAQWVVPTPNWRTGKLTRLLRDRVPAASALEYWLFKNGFAYLSKAVTEPGPHRRMLNRICERNLRTVRDPLLRARMTPTYEPGCKRMVFSGGFYRSIQKPGVDVVTSGIDRIEPRGIVTDDKVMHPADVLVLATGFDAHAYLRPIELIGPGGRTLAEVWRDGPYSYRTVGLPGFPNFFMLMGPNSPIGNYSLIAIAEAQAEFALRWITEWQRGRFRTAMPSAEATTRFNNLVRGALPNTVWASGCDSWYLGPDGTPELWPWNPRRHERMLARDHRTEYLLDADSVT